MAMGVAQPHDKFLKALLEDPAVVLALLREHLPPALSAQLSQEAPVLVDGTFVDEALRESRSDRLYRVLLRAKEELAVHILLEHKSASEHHAMLQVLGYMVHDWERLSLSRGPPRRLPPIVPVVLYHGASPWRAPQTFVELLEPHATALGVRPLDFGVVLLDLGALDDEHLAANPTLKAGLLTLKYASRDGLQARNLRKVLQALVQAPRLFRTAFRYILSTYRGIDRPTLLEETQRVLPARMEEVMTIAEELMEEGRRKGLLEGQREGQREGRVEGRVEGRIEAQRETLVRILGHRFRAAVPADVRERLMAASSAELDEWLDRALDAPNLDAVFVTQH